MKYEKNGQAHEFSIDMDKIADYEEANPDYEIFNDLESMDGLKFAVMRRLARFLGMDNLNDLKNKGLDLMDLAEIFKGCVKELGFSSDKPGSNSSSEKAE